MESEVVQWFYITCQEINVGLGRLDSSSTYMYSPYLFFFFGHHGKYSCNTLIFKLNLFVYLPNFLPENITSLSVESMW